MSTIITRAGKGSPLTNDEVDANFNNLNSTKVETSAVGTLSTQNANAVAITGGTINGATVGATTVAAGSFTTLNSSGNTRLGGLSGNQSLQVNNVASAVNYAQIVGAVAGGAPTLSAQGTDTNINVSFTPKGTGAVIANGSIGFSTPAGVNIGSSNHYLYQSAANTLQFRVGATPSYMGFVDNSGVMAISSGNPLSFISAGNTSFRIGNTAASVVNYIQVDPALTTAAPTLSAQGSDANINLKLTPKGTGVLQFGTYTAGILAQTGYITITDAGGTSRRLLVG